MVDGFPKASNKDYKAEPFDGIEEDRKPTLLEPPLFCRLIMYKPHQNTVTVMIKINTYTVKHTEKENCNMN